MEYLTLDFQLADRYLSSICQITIITWKNCKPIHYYTSYIYPDCEIEEFLYNRHHISNEMVNNAPTLMQIWTDIYNLLDNKTVFIHKASQAITHLMNRALVDNLPMPTFTYCCTQSLSKRVWKDFKDYSLDVITDTLNITDIHNDSKHDALATGLLINRAIKKLNDDIENDKEKEITINNLYSKTGFAGGCIVFEKKIVYRSIKDKDTKEYKAKILLPNKKEKQYFDISFE